MCHTLRDGDNREAGREEGQGALTLGGVIAVLRFRSRRYPE